MNTLLIIVGGILVTALLAYAVVNFIPRKLHWIVSIILIGLAVLLVYKINFEIQKPITFHKTKKEKYSEVIDKLKIIRDALVDHKKVTGRYTADGDALISFIDTAKFAVTEIKNVPRTIQLGGGLTDVVEDRVVDTIGYREVRLDYQERDYKNMMIIPGTDPEEKFKIELGELVKMGVVAQVFEIKVDKALILKGMDYNLIKQEKEAVSGEEVRGEYISVGSLVDVSEDGNWPPSYDKAEAKDNE